MEPITVGKGWKEVKVIDQASNPKPVANTEIFETTRYDLFILDIHNRPLNEARVNHFVKEFKKGNFFMKEFPAIIDKKHIILDGQHRFAACKELLLPFYFRYADTLALFNIVDVQVNAGWSQNDYIHSFIQQKNMNYIILKRFTLKYKIGVALAAALLSGITHRTSLKSIGFYNGSFKVKDEAAAHKAAAAIADIGSLIVEINPKLHISRDTHFNMAMAKIINHPDFDKKRMVDQIKKYCSLILRQVSTEAYILNLEEVYSYKMYLKNKVRFI